MKRDHVIEGMIGAATTAALVISATLAIRLEMDAKEVINALLALAGIGLGVMGGIWGANYSARRGAMQKQLDERHAVKAALAGLVASFEGWETDLPTATGPQNDQAIQRMIGGMILVRDYLDKADHFATALTFLERAIVSPWPGECQKLIRMLEEYVAALSSFHRGGETFMYCDNLRDAIFGQVAEMKKTAISDVSEFLSGNIDHYMLPAPKPEVPQE